MTWPGEPTRAGSAVRVRAPGGAADERENIERPGEWSLFRLLDQATLAPGATPLSFVAVWKLHTRPGEVKIAFKPAARKNPFLDEEARAFMQVFRHKDVFPPRTISKGAECPPR